jgi:hypothetical protein
MAWEEWCMYTLSSPSARRIIYLQSILSQGDTYMSQSLSHQIDPVCMTFFLGTLPRAGFMHMCATTFPCLFDEDVFIAAQCISVSQLNYNFEMDLKGSQCLFNLQSSVEGESGAPSRCFRCRELNTELHKFWDCSPTLCYQLSLWVSLFTCNIILHMFNITKLTSTYIPLWILCVLSYFVVYYFNIIAL